MTRRSVVVFWGTTAAAVFFLGSAWAAAGRLSGPHVMDNAAVLVIAVVGFVATTLVAGRIAFVIGRAQRRARTREASRGGGSVPARRP